MTFGSLFTGIGGFDLGLEWAGMECKWQVEIDPFCNKVLAKHWPKVRRYGDIKEVHVVAAHGKCLGWKEGTGKRIQSKEQISERPNIGNLLQKGNELCPSCLPPVDLICGGFPCQPYSCAGKRRGKEDDRALWPEMLRVISEIRPRWVIGENVGGFVNMGLDDCVSSLEAEGYEVQPFIIPACAVNAPHRRDRVWIVGHASRTGRQQESRSAHGYEGKNEGWSKIQSNKPSSSSQDVADSETVLSQRCDNGQREGEPWGSCWWQSEPDVCGIFNGLSKNLDGGGLNASKGMDKESKIIVEKILRDVWEGIVVRSSPYRQQSDEQLTREFADSLLSVPHKVALGKREATLEAIRFMSLLRQTCQKIGILRNPQQSLSETWESISEENKYWIWMAIFNGKWWNEWPGVPRVAVGVKGRVDRLKSLGNAVVPQIPYIIGKAIMEIEVQRP